MAEPVGDGGFVPFAGSGSTLEAADEEKSIAVTREYYHRVDTMLMRALASLVPKG